MTASSANGERAARIAIGVWALLWACNDSLPYFGGRDDSCQTMFSSLEWGLTPDGRSWNNHLVLPQLMVFDAWVNIELRDVVIEGEARDARERALYRWMQRPGRDRNIEAVRVAVDRLCEHHAVRFSFRRELMPPSAEWETTRWTPEAFGPEIDACHDPSVGSPRWWVPVRLFETDMPSPDAPISDAGSP
jgi:hypothetical protein